jgi:serine/threonine-protein kinase
MFGVIASGGMAAVHYGLMNGPVGFRRTVAIKRLHEQFAEDPEFVSQFLDEARLAARIRHPNVVQTLDVVAQNRQLLLVMEYVDGETLGRLLAGTFKGGAKVPIEQAVGIVTGALHGLHAAHEASDEHGLPLRIVHRDVSPQNILVGRDGVARVLDFGVAKAAARVHSTQGAKIKGKLRYMSPEQVGGSGVDRRTDVFAAGVVLWESLAGRRLFDSKEGAGAIINQVLTKRIPPPSQLRAELPRV